MLSFLSLGLEVFSNKQLLVFFSQCERHVVSVSVLKTIGRLKESRATVQRPPCKSSFCVTILYKLTLRLKKKPQNDWYQRGSTKWQGILAAPYSNMWTLEIKAQPANAFSFASVNLMFGGSSQLPTTAERAVIISIISSRKAQFRQHRQKLAGVPEHLIDGSEQCICRLSFEV